MEFQKLKALVEALLYVSEGPLPMSRIRESIGEDAQLPEIKEALMSVITDFDSAGRGVRIAELAGGYQIITRAEHAPYIKRLQKIKPPKLTAQSLETLAIIAYRQPIIRAEVEAIRGVSSGGTLKTLLERRLIRMAGRQDVPGKPIMYATTHEFLRYFGLKDLASLPPLRELERELGIEENSILSNLEPELPGLDGPELEKMAAEYRAHKAAMLARPFGELGDEGPDIADTEPQPSSDFMPGDEPTDEELERELRDLEEEGEPLGEPVEEPGPAPSQDAPEPAPGPEEAEVPGPETDEGRPVAE